MLKKKKKDHRDWMLDVPQRGVMQPLADLLDALLVLNEQLHTWNVDVEPRPLRGALHRSVDAAIVLAAHTEDTDANSETDFS